MWAPGIALDMATIKTPDQRVRVFISSTINELADERKAAREAIGNLRLIPVFFEAGARPHPPRDLYSAYLEQSHIFLGIYWNSYGWVAPGAEISGLEDEYRLCGNRKPKLIYVKRSTDRQERLNDLLKDIERSDSACYQQFSDAAELQRLIENDLSVLMSEIFENALSEQGAKEDALDAKPEKVPQQLIELPHIRSEIYGRDEDIGHVTELLLKPGIGLVTLLGAGGTGKTTLSIHIGHRVKDAFRDGVAFVPLAPITDHRLVAASIAEVLGVQDSGKQPIEATLAEYLSDKQLLLILDNFEQVADASRMIGELTTRCKDLKVLVTSRTSLHVRNERIYNLATLGIPEDAQRIAPEELRRWPGTQLFVERALEVNPRLELNRENTDAIIEICQRMDGLPLAIELAAARTRFFQPAALLSRIEKTLDLVSKGHKDLPERQQTLRGAIEWSYNLLSDDTKRVFRQLGVFRRSWTLEAADAILKEEGIDLDIEEMTERLLDVSLIKPVLVSHSAEPRFNMLQTVHEYAKEMLDAAPEAEATKRRFADYYLRLLEETDGKLWERNGDAWLDLIELEQQNIRAAFSKFIQWGELEQAWRFIPHLAPYWTIRGGFSESNQLIADARIMDKSLWDSTAIDARTRARTLTWAGYSTLFLFDFANGFPMLQAAARIAEEIGDEHTLAYALCVDGCYGSYLNNPDAPPKVVRGFELAEKLNDSVLHTMLLLWSTEYFRQQGDMAKVMANLESAWRIAMDDGNTYILGATCITRFSFQVMDPANDWNATVRQAIEMYDLFPEKGYKGLKSAAMQALAFGHMKLGALHEAEVALRQGLEYSRVAGEKESEVYSTMEASGFFVLKGELEKAFRIFGALDAFIEMSHYPIVGGAEAQYKYSKELLLPHWESPDAQRWYSEGRRMSLADAIVYALHG